MAKVAVSYYSAAGTTYKLARAAEEGAAGAGAHFRGVRFCKVRELAPDEAVAASEGRSARRLGTRGVLGAASDDLEWADALRPA